MRHSLLRDLSMKDPRKIRRRVLLISGLNGWSIIIAAGFFAVISLLLGDGLGFLVGAAVLVSPWMELKARARLQQERAGARQWYLWSQVCLFGVIVVYSVSQLLSLYFTAGTEALPPDVRQALHQLLQLDERALNDLMGQIYLAVYVLVILASLLYQGGLFLFYRRNVRPAK